MEQSKDYQEMGKIVSSCEDPSAPANEYKQDRDEPKKKKSPGPGKFPPILSSKYPEDDPDYCIWVPPEGQSGDGRTHLNDKYGYWLAQSPKGRPCGPQDVWEETSSHGQESDDRL